MSPRSSFARPQLVAALWLSACASTSQPAGAPEPAPLATPEPAAAPSATPEVAPAPTAAEPAASDPIQAAVAASDRSPADRELDAGRRPAQLLGFFGIAPGMRVAELGAGGGYTAELLARIVGQSGRVYGHNTPLILQRFAEKPWSERLSKPVMANVIRVDRDFSDPLPPDAKDLDAVLCILFYHDTVWQKTDRDKMNKAIFAALKPGGVYGIVDHSARAGSGLSEVETLHRIEESALRREVERAGFVVDATADFLRNSADTRDWNASPRAAAERRGTSDRFVIRFKRP